MNGFIFGTDQEIIVKENNLFGIINLQGDWTVLPQYEEISHIYHNRRRIKMAGVYGYLNENSDIAIPPKFEAAFDFYQGIQFYCSSIK